jgi:predicted esterase
MPISLPKDLPSSLKPVLHPESPNLASIANIVIFLPGLGDTATNFSSFSRALNLPSTLTLTLQAPIPIPVPDAGTHWGDDLVMDTSTGTIDADGPSFNTSTKLLAEDVINNILIKKCGFKPREIMIFGYGQGASVALATSLHPAISNLELGGIIAIGGLLPLSQPSVNQSKSRTPVILLGGSKGVLNKDGGSAVKRVKEIFTSVEIHQWKKQSDNMPSNREEATPMMAFFARRLRSRQGVPSGAVEIS